MVVLVFASAASELLQPLVQDDRLHRCVVKGVVRNLSHHAREGNRSGVRNRLHDSGHPPVQLRLAGEEALQLLLARFIQYPISRGGVLLLFFYTDMNYDNASRARVLVFLAFSEHLARNLYFCVVRAHQNARDAAPPHDGLMRLHWGGLVCTFVAELWSSLKHPVLNVACPERPELPIAALARLLYNKADHGLLKYLTRTRFCKSFLTLQII